jgi:Glycosyltransferase family 87
MSARRLPPLDLVQAIIVVALLSTLAFASLNLFTLAKFQAPGADFSCFWAGAKTALSDPSKIYDFQHNTMVQGWPLGPGRLRPYIYPPTALLVFAPFTLAGYWTDFALWVALTGGLFVWGASRIRAPWWLVLIMPPVALAAYCGQVTFLMGGLVLAGLSMRNRPILAGVLFGIAASIKPQFMVLVPLALLAEGRWRTLLSAGLTGLALCLVATLIWGPQMWLDWLGAVGRFKTLIFNDRALTATAITPYAALVAGGHNGAWAFLLAPVAVAMVWFGFRRTADLADRSLLLFGATILVTPYAMNYELALFAPGVAIYLSRLRDPRWVRYAAAALGYSLMPWAFPAVLPAVALALAPLLRPSLTRDNAEPSTLKAA